MTEPRYILALVCAGQKGLLGEWVSSSPIQLIREDRCSSNGWATLPGSTLYSPIYAQLLPPEEYTHPATECSAPKNYSTYEARLPSIDALLEHWELVRQHPRISGNRLSGVLAAAVLEMTEPFATPESVFQAFHAGEPLWETMYSPHRIPVRPEMFDGFSIPGLSTVFTKVAETPLPCDDSFWQLHPLGREVRMPAPPPSWADPALQPELF